MRQALAFLAATLLALTSAAAPPVEPGQAQAALDAAAPYAWVQIAPGPAGSIGPALTIRKPVQLSGMVGQPNPVLAGIRIQGRVTGLSLHHLTLKGGGIESIDGLSQSLLSDLTIDGCTTGIALEQSDGTKPPIYDVTIRRTRIRNASNMGVLIGSAFGVKLQEIWVHRAGIPGNTATHAYYLNDDCVTGDATACWATDSATGFRGSLTRATDLLVQDCGWGIASGKNCERCTRPASIRTANGAGLEINAQNTIYIEEPFIWGGPTAIAVNARTKSTWLRIAGGSVAGSAAAFELNASPIDQYGRGRGDISDIAAHGTTIYGPNSPSWYHWANIQAGSPLANGSGRTLEDYDRQVLGGPGTKDHLWEAQGWSQAAVTSWLRN